MKKISLKNNKLAIIALAALLVVGIVGGTFAYFNQTLTAENKFTVGAYGTQIEETFTPPETWTPGTETTKEVWVTNTGDISVVVRVAYEESWIGEDGTTLGNTITVDGKTVDVALKNWTKPSNWIDGEDGYFYYKEIVIGGEKTSNLLDSVTFNPAANVAATEVKSEQKKQDDGTYTTVITETKNAFGYDNATYTLKFTGSTVQADKDAIMATWGILPDAIAGLFAD